MNQSLRIDVFCDSADLSVMRGIVEQYPFVSGWTSNPSICRRCGVSDYRQFVSDALNKLPALPLSVEVIADDEAEMRRQAHLLATMAKNCNRQETLYVKIPIVNSCGQSMAPLIHELSNDGIQINATAILSWSSVCHAANALHDGAPSYLSVFVGRLADSGVEPLEEMPRYINRIHKSTRAIWASPREPLNVLQAQRLDFDVITVFHEFIKKLHIFGKEPGVFEVETATMFYQDAKSSGFTL